MVILLIDEGGINRYKLPTGHTKQIMMRIVDKYVFRNVLVATVFITLVLAVLILLTQSLRFLELVISSGASGLSFWVLTILTLPKFLEAIMPLGLMAAVLFVYNRLTMDSELVVLRALGFSPLRLARPALTLSVMLAAVLFLVMGWLAPVTNASLQQLRVEIKAEMSTLLFREGIFNQAGKGLMVYVRDRTRKGELEGLLIYDARDSAPSPATIIANRGVVVSTDEGQQVLVYDGSRQDFDKKQQVLKRLDFSQYTIDLPEPGPARVRWAEPEERTINQLLAPDLTNERDRGHRKDFVLELNKRLLTPFLVMTFTVISLCALLLGPLDRRGQSKRIIGAVGVVITIQALYLSFYNLSKVADIGLLFMYLIVFGPLIAGFFLLLRDSQVGGDIADDQKRVTLGQRST
jgi:lipopolysaccharide export system permease protein